MRFRRYALLVSVLLVSLALLTLQTRGVGLGRAADVVGVLTTPFQVVLAKAHRGALSLWSAYIDWKSVRTETLALRAENERLRVQSLLAVETQAENARLRHLLELRERLPLSTLAGEVIGREESGWVRALTINRGWGDGINPQTPAIVPAGLVGRVVRVRIGASVIQLLNDPASTVGAMVQRTRTVGLVEGEPSGTVRFKFMARDGAAISPGDLIVTAGQGSIFPKGLPVGRVTGIEDKGSALFHFAVIAPVADFTRVDEVLLLTGHTAQDLAGLFPADR